MKLIGARVAELDEGVVVFEVDFRPELSPQNGFFHAGIVATLVDTAGGCAGGTMMPAGSNVLTVEYLTALGRIGDGRATKLVIPTEFSGLLGMLAAVVETSRAEGGTDELRPRDGLPIPKVDERVDLPPATGV